MVIAKKPLLRGWPHAIAAVGAVVLTVAWLIRSAPNWGKTLSLGIFGATSIVLYTVSACYHIGTWTPAKKRRWRTLDRIAIFLPIAGTSTPLCWNLLQGIERLILLSLIWSLALVGIAAAIEADRGPRWLAPVLYGTMGASALSVLPVLVAEHGWQSVALLISGGVIYLVGSSTYARRRPNPWPSTLGFHELFHLCTIAGGACVATVIGLAVIPR